MMENLNLNYNTRIYVDADDIIRYEDLDLYRIKCKIEGYDTHIRRYNEQDETWDAVNEYVVYSKDLYPPDGDIKLEWGHSIYSYDSKIDNNLLRMTEKALNNFEF